MGLWRIDICFHGPLRSVERLQDHARSSGERQMIYLARHPDITALAKAMQRRNWTTDSDEIEARCKVAYVGLTRGVDLGSRFENHHKIDPDGFASLKQGKLTEFYAGYLMQPPGYGEDPFKRLKVAEDVLISWFLPPLNTQGIKRATRNGEELGSGSTGSALVAFAWRTASGGPRTPPPGFPAQLAYAWSKGLITAL